MRRKKNYFRSAYRTFESYFPDLVVVIFTLFILLSLSFVASLMMFRSIGFSETAVYNLIYNRVPLSQLFSSYFFPSFLSLLFFFSIFIFIQGAVIGAARDASDEIKPNLKRAFQHASGGFFSLFLLCIIYLFLIFTTALFVVFPSIITYLLLLSPIAVIEDRKGTFSALKTSYRKILKKPADYTAILVVIAFLFIISGAISFFFPAFILLSPVLSFLSGVYSVLLLTEFYKEVEL